MDQLCFETIADKNTCTENYLCKQGHSRNHFQEVNQRHYKPHHPKSSMRLTHRKAFMGLQPKKKLPIDC